MTLGWKLEKGSLEQKRENFRSLIGEANERIKGQRPDSIRILYEVFYHLKNQKVELLVQNAFPRILESITVGPDACQIAMFRD